MIPPESEEEAQALNREVTEQVRQQLGHLVQQVIVLQVHNAALVREVERLRAQAAATAAGSAVSG